MVTLTWQQKTISDHSRWFMEMMFNDGYDDNMMVHDSYLKEGNITMRWLLLTGYISRKFQTVHYYITTIREASGKPTPGSEKVF